MHPNVERAKRDIAAGNAADGLATKVLKSVGR
jgi:hypothetical protein